MGLKKGYQLPELGPPRQMADSPPEKREPGRGQAGGNRRQPWSGRESQWPVLASPSFVGLERNPGTTGTSAIALRASHLTEPQLTPGSNPAYCCPGHRQKCLPTIACLAGMKKGSFSNNRRPELGEFPFTSLTDFLNFILLLPIC